MIRDSPAWQKTFAEGPNDTGQESGICQAFRISKDNLIILSSTILSTGDSFGTNQVFAYHSQHSLQEEQFDERG
jgi:hypothetical protein